MPKIHRRDFVTQTASTLVFPAVLTQRGLAAKGPASERIRMGMVGAAGRASSLNHIFAKNKDVEIAGIAEIDPRRLPQTLESVTKIQGNKPRTFTDFRKLVEDPTIDALCVGTPDHWHAIPTILGCLAGKDIYVEKPDSEVIKLEPDQVFPYFILTTIPAGLAGLTIAGVLAAAMSSLDSSINAIATVTTVDILKPWVGEERDDRFYLLAARCIAIGAAVLMIAGAIVFSSIEKESMNDLSWIIASVFGGCLMGLFMVGFFTKRVDECSAMVALALSISINIYLGLGVAGLLPESITFPIHSYWVGLFVNLAFVVIAVAVSRFRKQKGNLEGLTVWTIKRQSEI